jgi:hypothetical protein
MLQWELASHKEVRIASATMMGWRFTAEKAHIKLQRLYPVFHD